MNDQSRRQLFTFQTSFSSGHSSVCSDLTIKDELALRQKKLILYMANVCGVRKVLSDIVGTKKERTRYDIE